MIEQILVDKICGLEENADFFPSILFYRWHLMEIFVRVIEINFKYKNWHKDLKQLIRLNLLTKTFKSSKYVFLRVSFWAHVLSNDDFLHWKYYQRVLDSISSQLISQDFFVDWNISSQFCYLVFYLFYIIWYTIIKKYPTENIVAERCFLC